MTNSQDFGTYAATGETSLAGDYPATPYPPSDYAATTPSYGSTGTQTSSSTADVAKDQAAGVAGGAADAAQHVAGVAKEQVGQVTAEAGRQVRQLFGQAQSELSDQAQAQQQKLAGGLHEVGDQLRSMAHNSQEQGLATDIARQAADRAHSVASWFESRDPASVLDEVRSYARRRPGMFLAVALGAGLVAGRLARGLAAEPDSNRNDASAGVRPSVAPGSYAALDTSAVRDADLYGNREVADWTGSAGNGLGDGR